MRPHIARAAQPGPAADLPAAELGDDAVPEAHARQLLLTASNYLLASAYLLRNPRAEDTHRLLDRAAILIGEAGDIMDLLKRSRMHISEISNHVSVRALIEKAGSWLISPDGSKVGLTTAIGPAAAFIACHEEEMVRALSAALGYACEALDGQVERRIAASTQRIDGQVEIAISYRGRALSEALGRTSAPAEHLDYRRIVEAQGGRVFAEYRADGGVTVRILLPASR